MRKCLTRSGLCLGPATTPARGHSCPQQRSGGQEGLGTGRSALRFGSLLRTGMSARRWWRRCSRSSWRLALGARCVRRRRSFIGKAAPEWDALFQRESGWIGADGDYSIPLNRDTTLWLFSDTFVGKVKDGKRLDARMINNSIALQRGTNAPEFFYGTTTDGKPASFITPQQGSRRGYFWLAHGMRTARGLFSSCSAS